MSDQAQVSKHRAAAAEWQRHRRRQQAYGRWRPYVDAEPVRAHVRELTAAGLGFRRIAELAGVNPRLIGYLMYGTPYKGIPPTRRIRPNHAAALLAVQARPSALAGGTLTDGTGTRRRLRALIALGWPAGRLADQLGMNRTAVRALIRADGRPVKVSTARKVAALYDRLWETPGPSAAARARATEAGWSVPLAWDDESIDDPAAQPAEANEPNGLRSRELWQDSEELRAQGLSFEVIAERLGVALGTLKRAREQCRASERRAQHAATRSPAGTGHARTEAT